MGTVRPEMIVAGSVVENSPRAEGYRNAARRLDLAAFALPALLWTSVFFLSPLVLMGLYSFWTFSGGQIVPEWTLANYRDFFVRDYFTEALVNSLEVATLATLLSLAIAYPAAWILAFKVPKRWQIWLLAAAMLPFFTSYLVRNYSWMLVLSDRGVINTTLIGIGIIDQPLAMAHGRGATLLGFVHFFSMLLTLTIYTNLVQINPRYMLAASDLGASPWRTFLRVTLPLSVPGIAAGSFLTFVMAIGDFVTPQLLGGGKEMLLPQTIMLSVTRYVNLPAAAAMSVILFAVVTLFYLLCARHLRMDRL